MKNHDPMLRMAMKEIEGVMKKYDIGGFVSLGSRTHSKCKLFIEPSWSLATLIEKNGRTAINFKVRMKTDPENSNYTSGLLMGIRELCGLAFMQMDHLKTELEKAVGLEHQPFGPNGITTDDA